MGYFSNSVNCERFVKTENKEAVYGLVVEEFLCVLISATLDFATTDDALVFLSEGLNISIP